RRMHRLKYTIAIATFTYQAVLRNSLPFSRSFRKLLNPARKSNFKKLNIVFNYLFVKNRIFSECLANRSNAEIFPDENLDTSVRCLPLYLLQKVRDEPQEHYEAVRHTTQNGCRFPMLQIVFRCCLCSILSLSKGRLSCQANLLVLL